MSSATRLDCDSEMRHGLLPEIASLVSDLLADEDDGDLDEIRVAAPEAGRSPARQLAAALRLIEDDKPDADLDAVRSIAEAVRATGGAPRVLLAAAAIASEVDALTDAATHLRQLRDDIGDLTDERDLALLAVVVGRSLISVGKREQAMAQFRYAIELRPDVAKYAEFYAGSSSASAPRSARA